MRSFYREVFCDDHIKYTYFAFKNQKVRWHKFLWRSWFWFAALIHCLLGTWANCLFLALVSHDSQETTWSLVTTDGLHLPAWLLIYSHGIILVFAFQQHKPWVKVGCSGLQSLPTLWLNSIRLIFKYFSCSLSQ